MKWVANCSVIFEGLLENMIFLSPQSSVQFLSPCLPLSISARTKLRRFHPCPQEKKAVVERSRWSLTIGRWRSLSPNWASSSWSTSSRVQSSPMSSYPLSALLLHSHSWLWVCGQLLCMLLCIYVQTFIITSWCLHVCVRVCH